MKNNLDNLMEKEKTCNFDIYTKGPDSLNVWA